MNNVRERITGLLKTWCDTLLAYQITSPRKEVDGAILCPACNMIHGRCPDLIYPLMYLADTLHEDRYLQGALRLFRWGDYVICDDGSMRNDAFDDWRGITVFNAAGSNSKAVAEHAIALMFGLVRQLPQLNKSTREGKWERLTFREFSSLTIGFIGFGGIARLTAERLAPFGSRLIAYDKFPNKEAAQERNVTLTSLEEVLRTSDIVSIHAPSLPDTFHMINREALAMMKKTAYLVNTARGPLVDELALYDALVSGTLAGAGLDVYEQEPISPDNPLLSLDCVLCTPHSAAETLETYHNVGTFTAENVVAYFQGRTPENWLNP